MADVEKNCLSQTIIIGGGIAGLSAAYYLQEFSTGRADFTLIEDSAQWGGKIATVHENGFLIEGGPDSFLTQKKAALDLCRALGLESSLSGSKSSEPSTTYVWNNGQLHAIPEGMMLMAPTMILPFLQSKLISWPGKMRMGMEALIPRKTGGEDESLAQFVRRRLGREMLDKIAAPLMAGIHSADAEKLSISSTFPMFPEMERAYGGLLRGMIRKKRQSTKASSQKTATSMFMTLEGGLGQLSEAIVDRLPPRSLRLNCRVKSVSPLGYGYRVALRDGTYLLADDVIFATPSYVTAELVEAMDPALAGLLRSIPYVSTATVSLGFRRGQIHHPLNGFGFIVPATEPRRITACSWSSQKFTHRAPEDCVLLRVFAGGALAERNAGLDDASLLQLAREELRTIMGIEATPVVARVFRWPRAHPQYEVGHGARVTAIETALQAHPRLHLAGAAYRGSGIPDIIQNAMNAAMNIAAKLEQTRNAGAILAVPISV